jgi:hypothetical protein
MLILFQTIFILFAVFATISVLKKKHEGVLGPKGTAFWVLFWILTMVAVLWPNGITELANAFGIGRGADFVLYIALVVLFYLIFRLNVKLEGLARGVTKLVRREAIDNSNPKS